MVLPIYHPVQAADPGWVGLGHRGSKDGGYAHQILASESPTFHTEGVGVLRYAILSISVTRQNPGCANN